MKEKFLVLCVFGFLVVWSVLPNSGFSQNPVPDIMANGYDTPLNLIPPLDLTLTLSLNSGDLTDPADWWLVVVWPEGVVSLTSEGWKPGLQPAYTGPLFELPPIDLTFPSAMVPSMTPFRIFLAVDLPGNGVLDPGRLYWDMVTFTKSETSGEEVPGEEVGKSLFPAYMYYLERVLTGLPHESQIEQQIATALEESPDTLPLLSTLVSRYQEIPQAVKLQLFDPQIVQLTLDPSIAFDFETLKNRVTTLNPDLMIHEFDTPGAPTGLTATNATTPPDPDIGLWHYQVSLSWQDNAANEDGYLIYRLCYPAIMGTAPSLIAQVGANVTDYLDDSLTAPLNSTNECCYHVTAFKTSQFFLVGQPPAKLESDPSNTTCSNYAYEPPAPLVDSDNDGVPDDFDDCPLDHAEGAPWTNGCPDDDEDGVPNKDDACKLVWGEKANGCPLKYQIRWMGMDVLNNSGAYAWPGYTFQGLSGSLFNEVDPYAGEEPYLLFAFVNGMSSKGAKESGANKWCCGEEVIVPKTGPAVDSDNDGYPDNHEPDTVPGVPVLGTTIYENQYLLDHGFTAFPGFATDYSEIDSKHGLVMTVSLMERDWTITVTPDSQASAVDAAIKGAGALAGGVAGCVGSAGLGCLLGIGGAMKTIIESILDLSNKPDPVTVTDPDDPMGTSIWAITRGDATFKTSDNGTYAFWFPVPTTYKKSCLGWEPCGAGQGVAITMRSNAYFCLVREDVPEAEVKSRCGDLSTYSQVLPWPMTASSP